jgi:glycosyltransferase involved in cell wall biosynthesis
MLTNLTTIIPCKNEFYGVIECLKLVETQTYKSNIIIADSSDSESKYILHDWCKGKSWIQIIEGGLPALARNSGAKIADTDYILFLDADMMLYDKNIIEVCMKRATEFDLITIHVKSDDGKWNWVWNFFSWLQKFLSKKTPFALGGFQLWKKESFFKLGGFDERIKVAEDWCLSKKVNPKKFKVLDRNVYTSSRRFEKKGVTYMLKLMILSYINKNNPNWFYDSHSYWN